MGSLMYEEGDKAFNESVLEMQQQLLAHKERTNYKLQKLEHTIELARQKMQQILSIKARRQDRRLSYQNNSTNKLTLESLTHLNSEIEGTRVIESLQNCKHQLDDKPVYDEQPVYDEEPEEGQDCWQEQEFILEAIKGGSPDSPNPLNFEASYGDKKVNILKDAGSTMNLVHSGLCEELEPAPQQSSSVISMSISVTLSPPKAKLFEESSKREAVLVTENASGDDLNISTNLMEASELQSDMKLWPSRLAPGQGDIPKIVGCYKVIEQQGASEDGSSMIHVNMRKVVEAFPCKVTVKCFLTAEHSYDLGLRSSNFIKGNMLIFDPGGQVQNKQLKGFKFEDMVTSVEKLEEAVMKIFVGGQLGHFQDINLRVPTKEKLLKGPSQLNIKVYIVQIENSARVQGRQGNPARGKRIEVHDASRKRAKITIFDPGGYVFCFYNAQLVSSTPGILYVFQLQEVLNGKEVLWKGKDSIVAGALSRMHDAPENSADRRLTSFDPP